MLTPWQWVMLQLICAQNSRFWQLPDDPFDPSDWVG